MSSYVDRYDIYKTQVEDAIVKVLNLKKDAIPKDLFDAMEYGVCGGGKRIRGVIVAAVGDMVGADKERVSEFAAAVEMIHASSLIHDDMPCMDNDTMRRGKPCTHIAFGEATALYAGLGLLNLAYEILLNRCDSLSCFRAVRKLAESAGVTGIMKGQCLDIYYEGKDVDFDTLKTIHSCKTGSLLIASAVIPAIIADCEKAVINALYDYGKHIGTAFQIIDDVLDVTETSSTLGKTAGKDEKADKLTYVKIFGVDKAMELANEHIDSAISCLTSINMESGFLKETAKLIVKRRN